jgi:hypothetical protein
MRKRCGGIFCFTIGRAHFKYTQVIELNPSGYLGYQLKHEALHGAHCYDEAIEAFQIMLLKLDEAPDPQIQSKLRIIHVSNA